MFWSLQSDVQTGPEEGGSSLGGGARRRMEVKRQVGVGFGESMIIIQHCVIIISVLAACFSSMISVASIQYYFMHAVQC